MNRIAFANSVHDSTEWKLTQFVLIRFLVEAVDAGIIIVDSENRAEYAQKISIYLSWC